MGIMEEWKNGRMEGWKDGSLTCILTRIKLKCKYEKIDQ